MSKAGSGANVTSSAAMTSRLAAAIFVGLVAVVFGIELIQRSNLGDHIPFLITLFAALFGGFLGFLAATMMATSFPQDRSLRQIFGICALPIFSVFIGTFLARSLFLQIAFLGIDTLPIEDKAIVMDRETYGGKMLGRHRVDISIEQDSRHFRVLVTPDLHAAIGSQPVVGVHCLRVTVEIGRWGYRKVLAPNYFDEPIGMDRYVRC